MPGSLSETATLIERAGRQVIVAPADITDRASLGAAATTVLERWGHVDVVVHNARFVGPGHMDTFLDTPISAIEHHMEGNFFAPLVLDKLFVPRMIERGGGRIVTITSSVGYSDPVSPAGDGGWGISYGATKAAIHRVAGILATELASAGILSFNVDPGFTRTERIAQDMAKFGFGDTGEPPEVVGAVVRWLASDATAGRLNGSTVFAQQFCAEQGLLDGYTGARNPISGVRPDVSGARLAELVEPAR